MNKLNNLEIEFQELSDNELETVVGGTSKSSKRVSHSTPCPPPAPVCPPPPPAPVCKPCDGGYSGYY